MRRPRADRFLFWFYLLSPALGIAGTSFVESPNACIGTLATLPSISKKLPSLGESNAFYDRQMRARRSAKIMELRLTRRNELAEAYALSEVEKGLIEDYSAYDYEDFNQLLRRDAEKGERSGLNRNYAKIKTVLAALAKIPPEPTISFRGMNLKRPQFEKFDFKVGGVLDDPAFISSDLDPSENEILFLPHTRFKILSIEDIGRRKFMKIEEVVAEEGTPAA